jgi:hypothetical protein
MSDPSAIQLITLFDAGVERFMKEAKRLLNVKATELRSMKIPFLACLATATKHTGQIDIAVSRGLIFSSKRSS